MWTARLQLIRDHGCKAGMVLNPATPLDWMDHVMDKLDIILLMSVNPGFGGQKFIPSTLPKLRAVRARIEAHVAAGGQPIWLEVDGGVKTDNIADIVAAGADTCVAGSAVFGAPDADGGYHTVMQRCCSAAAQAPRLSLRCPECLNLSRRQTSHDHCVQPFHPDAVPDRRASPLSQRQRRLQCPDAGRGAGLQGHCPLGGLWRTRQRAGQPCRARGGHQRQRAGRGAEEARRASATKYFTQTHGVGRPPGGHGLRGDGPRPTRFPSSPAARQVPAGVRPAGRLQQHRRERVGGQHFQHPARAAGRDRQRARRGRGRLLPARARSRWPPATRCTAPPPCWC